MEKNLVLIIFLIIVSAMIWRYQACGIKTDEDGKNLVVEKICWEIEEYPLESRQKHGWIGTYSLFTQTRIFQIKISDGNEMEIYAIDLDKEIYLYIYADQLGSKKLRLDNKNQSVNAKYLFLELRNKYGRTLPEKVYKKILKISF